MEQRHFARLEAKDEKELEQRVKVASKEESSVFHDVGEKRFELRFPGFPCFCFSRSTFLRVHSGGKASPIHKLEYQVLTSQPFLSTTSRARTRPVATSCRAGPPGSTSGTPW